MSDLFQDNDMLIALVVMLDQRTHKRPVAGASNIGTERVWGFESAVRATWRRFRHTKTAGRDLGARFAMSTQPPIGNLARIGAIMGIAACRAALESRLLGDDSALRLDKLIIYTWRTLLSHLEVIAPAGRYPILRSVMLQ
jgi:hypothetical protein